MKNNNVQERMIILGGAFGVAASLSAVCNRYKIIIIFQTKIHGPAYFGGYGGPGERKTNYLGSTYCHYGNILRYNKIYEIFF